MAVGLDFASALAPVQWHKTPSNLNRAPKPPGLLSHCRSAKGSPKELTDEQVAELAPQDRKSGAALRLTVTLPRLAGLNFTRPSNTTTNVANAPNQTVRV